ncbi:uncharacterized protein LOC101846341 isoform X2 [Aplysia californica]|nr:uncharacterized protein LOC101846341 isoform X2 [Aplysia californica]XP_012935930.1 uncharacterized protein LOC101846341 isoform X2 [Aplysia californica]
MDGDQGLPTLLSQGYAIINDLNKASDMTQKQKVLQRNGLLAKAKAKDLINNLHRMVDAFDTHLQTFIGGIVTDRANVLESHSNEIIQCVDYISKLCIMAEKVLKDQTNVPVTQTALESEFLGSLKECDELKYVDYNTFVSIDLEVDLQQFFEATLVKIVSKNSRNFEKHILHSLGFGDLSEHTDGVASKKFPLEKQLFNQGSFETNGVHGSERQATKRQQSVLNNNEPSSFQGKFALVTDKTASERGEVTHAGDPGKEVEHGLSKNFSQCSLSDASLNIQNHTRKHPDGFLSKEFSQCSLEEKAKSHSEKLSNTFGKVTSHITPDGLVKKEQSENVINMKDDGIFKPKVNTLTVSKLSNKVHLRPCYMDQTSGSSSAQTQKKSDKSSRADCPNWREGKIDLAAHDKSVASANSAMVSGKPLGTFGSRLDSNNSTHLKKNHTQTEEEEEKVKTTTLPAPVNLITCETVMETVEDKRPPNLLTTNQISCTKSYLSQKKEDIAVPPLCSLVTAPKESLNSKKQSQSMPKNADIADMKFSLRSILSTSFAGPKEVKGTLVKCVTGGHSTSFDHPTGLTVRSDGLLVVADTGNNRVKVLRDDELVMSIGGEKDVSFQRPSAVVCDSLDNMYVKDDHCVQAFDASGKKFNTFGQRIFQHPFGLALAKPTNKTCAVLVDETRKAPKVFSYTLGEDRLDSYSYTPLMQAGTPLSKVRFLAAHKNMVLASDLGSSMMYLSTVDGQFVKRFGKYGNGICEFREPSGVAVDAEGNWLVGDSKNNRIQAFTSDGYFLASVNLAASIRRPSGIHLTSDGLLYIINYLDNMIQVFKLHS